MGENGQGKTNLAEGIVFLCLGKSPRTHQDKEMIMSGSDYASVEAKVNKNVGIVDISGTISNFEDNKFFVNGNPVRKLGELFGNLVCVFFSPSELKIVNGAPSDRREFCDTDISMLSEPYYNLTQRYEKVLAQRNKLLKFEKDHAKIIDTIGVWDEQLASLASLIIRTRKSFISKLLPFAKRFLKEVSASRDDINIEYQGIKGETKEEIKANIKTQAKI